MNIVDLLQQSPDLPEYQGQYQAIYFEPIRQSGERFTVAIAAQSATESKVVQTIDPKIVKCMYGQLASNVQSFIGIITDSLNQHLATGGKLKDWTAPISGVYKGPLQSTYSNKGIEGIIFQGITSFGSLYNGQIVADALQELYPENDTAQVESENTRLITSVKQSLVEIDKIFSQRFNQRVKTKTGATVSIDYLGAHYNAGLSNFNVKSAKNASGAAQQKLFQLDVLRADRKAEAINDHQEFELLVSMDANASSEHQDQLGELILSADTLGLHVVNFNSQQQIVQHIVNREHAA